MKNQNDIIKAVESFRTIMIEKGLTSPSEIKALDPANYDEFWAMAQNEEYGLYLQSYSNIAGQYKTIQVREWAI